MEEGEFSLNYVKLMSGTLIKGRYPKIDSPKGKNALSVRHLGFGNKLKDISFDLKEGEILGITGLAGSGRSLLASCLFGDAKYSGEIIIHQHLKHITSPREAIKNGIALVPENRKDDSIFKTLDINENIALPSFKRFSRNLVLDHNYMRESVEDYISRVNIGEVKNNKLANYSGSNIQKALFAKWIMSRAKIFILDEPTRGVDIPTKIDIYNFINDLLRNKVAVILISSDIEEIFGICDRVAVLSDNTMVCDKPTSETTVEEVVKLAASNK